MDGRTLWLRELGLFNTILQGLVEHGIKLCFRRGGDLVVGFDIFLDGLTAKRYGCQHKLQDVAIRARDEGCISEQNLEVRSLPAAISFLELNVKTH